MSILQLPGLVEESVMNPISRRSFVQAPEERKRPKVFHFLLCMVALSCFSLSIECAAQQGRGEDKAGRPTGDPAQGGGFDARIGEGGFRVQIPEIKMENITRNPAGGAPDPKKTTVPAQTEGPAAVGPRAGPSPPAESSETLPVESAPTAQPSHRRGPTRGPRAAPDPAAGGSDAPPRSTLAVVPAAPEDLMEAKPTVKTMLKERADARAPELMEASPVRAPLPSTAVEALISDAGSPADHIRLNTRAPIEMIALPEPEAPQTIQPIAEAHPTTREEASALAPQQETPKPRESLTTPEAPQPPQPDPPPIEKYRHPNPTAEGAAAKGVAVSRNAKVVPDRPAGPPSSLSSLDPELRERVLPDEPPRVSLQRRSAQIASLPLSPPSFSAPTEAPATELPAPSPIAPAQPEETRRPALSPGPSESVPPAPPAAPPPQQDPAPTASPVPVEKPEPDAAPQTQPEFDPETARQAPPTPETEIAPPPQRQPQPHVPPGGRPEPEPAPPAQPQPKPEVPPQALPEAQPEAQPLVSPEPPPAATPATPGRTLSESPPIQPPSEEPPAPRVTAPVIEEPPRRFIEESFPSPFDRDALDGPDAREYLAAAAPVIEQISLLMTRAPSLAITDFDPSEPDSSGLSSDVLVKLEAMKRELQVLDSKTFAIIPPQKYNRFHSLVRESITETYQACEAVINFFNERNEADLKKVHEHLSKSRDLIRKTRKKGA